MSTRAHNFNAGPSILPVSVVEQTAKAILDFNNSGMGIMEISHRSKDFEKVIQEAQADLLTLMGLSDKDYSVVFVGGGASLQFSMVPMNFLRKKADYVVTGEWATKAAKEAKLFGEVKEAASSKDKNFNYIPQNLALSGDADYVHITTNNTLYGTRWNQMPNVGNVPLVADMSSDFLSRELDYSKFKLIYAGAQKNVGPAGVTVVVLHKGWAAECAKDNLPTMLKYKTHMDNGSMFNTPPALPVYVSGLTFKWLLKNGGLKAIEQTNNQKAAMVYGAIDAHPEFYKATVTSKTDRSTMNVTWRLPSEALEEKFLNEAKARKMIGLKGHRAVGGIRASIYNACPVESCQALAQFMEEFYKANK
ncbi:MAG: 3-phosphoserine/phosphohydroxythreonine transaminase [Oligoflexia bacterium]|nr:3-phosphoserine/phosphohydroxythreonine transaminase [Oligoflexia bacterium]